MLPLAAAETEFVKITNIGDTSSIISFILDKKMPSFVKYGPDIDNLDKNAYDIRGEGYSGKIYFIRLSNLESAAKYYFEIYSDNLLQGSYDFTTAPRLGVKIPETSYGYVTDSNGDDASGSIVYCHLESKSTGVKSAEYADLAGYTDEGMKEINIWSLNTGNFRTEGLTKWFNYDEDDIEIKIEVKGADLGDSEFSDKYTGSGGSLENSQPIVEQPDIALPKSIEEIEDYEIYQKDEEDQKTSEEKNKDSQADIQKDSDNKSAKVPLSFTLISLVSFITFTGIVSAFVYFKRRRNAL